MISRSFVFPRVVYSLFLDFIETGLLVPNVFDSRPSTSVIVPYDLFEERKSQKCVLRRK